MFIEKNHLNESDSLSDSGKKKGNNELPRGGLLR